MEPDVYLTLGPDWWSASPPFQDWAPRLRCVRASDNAELCGHFDYWHDAVAFCEDLGLTWEAVQL